MASRGTDELLIFTGNWNKKLVHNICETIGRSLGSADVSTFSDGEIKVDLREPIHGRDVVFIQSTSPPAGKNLLELLFMISAANRAGAKHITAIIPYFGYSRQDRKSSEGSNISAVSDCGDFIVNFCVEIYLQTCIINMKFYSVAERCCQNVRDHGCRSCRII